MSIRKITAVALCAGMALGATSVSAAPTGQMLADTCAGCHGTDGASVGPAAPSIAGLSEAYLVDTMVAFRDDARPSTIMGRIARGYSDEEYSAMAKVFAAMPIAKTDQQTDAAKVAAGAEAYDKGCAKCHDENGGLADDDAGILASQWLPYLAYSMEDFKSGARDMPKKMKKAVGKLSDADIDALNHFFASQK